MRCMNGLFCGFVRRRVTKKMAAPLAVELRNSYGGSIYYTAPQIQTAFRKLKIDPKFIDIAYAQFLELDLYLDTTGKDRSAYDSAKSLYQRYLPGRDAAAWEPAPANPYIMQGAGH